MQARHKEADAAADAITKELKGMKPGESFEKIGYELQSLKHKYSEYYSAEIQRINAGVHMKELGFPDCQIVDVNKNGQLVTRSADGKQLQFRKPEDMSSYDFSDNGSEQKKLGKRDFTVAADGSASYKVKPGDNLWTVAKDALSREGSKPSDTEVANLVKQIEKERKEKGKLLKPGETIEFPPLTVKGDAPTFGPKPAAPEPGKPGDTPTPGAKPGDAPSPAAKPGDAPVKPPANTPDAGVNPAGDGEGLRKPSPAGEPPKPADAPKEPPKVVTDPNTGEVTVTKSGDINNNQGLFEKILNGAPTKYTQADKLDAKGNLIERDITFGEPGAGLYFPNPDGGPPHFVAYVKSMVTKPNGDGTFDTTISSGTGSQYVARVKDGKILKWTKLQGSNPYPLGNDGGMPAIDPDK